MFSNRQILFVPPYLLPAFSYHFLKKINNTLMSMVKSVMFSSPFSSGGGCLW